MADRPTTKPYRRRFVIESSSEEEEDSKSGSGDDGSESVIVTWAGGKDSSVEVVPRVPPKTKTHATMTTTNAAATSSMQLGGLLLDSSDDDDASFERHLASLQITEKDRKLKSMGMEGIEVVDEPLASSSRRSRNYVANDFDDEDESLESASDNGMESSSCSAVSDNLFDSSESETSGGRFDRKVDKNKDNDDNNYYSEQYDNDDDFDALALIKDLDSSWSFDSHNKQFFLSRSTTTTTRWPKLLVPKRLFATLFDYQQSGVQWMATLHENGIGGILGDDMGMGKTYITLTFLGGLMRAGTIRNALVVVPLSVLRSWEKESGKVLKACVPKCRITVLTSSVKDRTRILQKALECSSSSPCLIISTYGLVQSSTRDFKSEDSGCYWDYVVLDEAHNIKNHATQTSLACRSVCRNSQTRRLMLTGTPILNSLGELWSLFDWATSGKLLGNLKGFNERFSKPIENARDKYASDYEIRKGQQVNEELQAKLRPHFLQRLKIDYLRDQLPEKLEMVVWTHLSLEQRRRYESFVDGEKSIVRAILSGEVSSALEAITWLKKLCGHPLLVDERFSGDHLKTALRTMKEKDIIQQSQKLKIVVDMVSEFQTSGHRTLIFSQSTRMLDILQRVLAGAAKVSRIDGSTKESDRQRLVDAFNSTRSTSDVMLLSTKAAGVGLTLTGADRVIVYDPSWTPAADNQAVDRAYRIGQTRPVLVYRMIAAGTVEEKMYEKQIHKEGILRTVFTDCSTVQRYFDRNELGRLFTLSAPGVCQALDMVRKETSHVKTDWDQHAFVTVHSGVVGLSLHGSWYSADPKQANEAEPETPFAGRKQQQGTHDLPQGRELDFVPLASTPPSGHRTIQGRSQKVLSGEGNILVPIGGSTRTVSSHPIDQTRNTVGSLNPRQKEDEIVVLLDSSDDESSVEVVEASTTSNKENDGAPDPLFERPSSLLKRAATLHQRGKSKGSLQMHLKLLKDHYQELSAEEKVTLHTGVAMASCSTGLLSDTNGNSTTSH